MKTQPELVVKQAEVWDFAFWRSVVVTLLLGLVAQPCEATKFSIAYPIDFDFRLEEPLPFQTPTTLTYVFRTGHGYGPIKRITGTMSPTRGLKYNGPSETTIDFQGRDSVVFPVTIVLEKNDTVGMLFALEIVLENGGIHKVDANVFILTGDSSYQLQHAEPPILDLQTYLGRYGTQQQQDSVRAAVEDRIYARYLDSMQRIQAALPPRPKDTGKVGPIVQGPPPTFEESRLYKLRQLKGRESVPEKSEYYGFSFAEGINLLRRKGEKEFRFFTPLTLDEKYLIHKRGENQPMIGAYHDIDTIHIQIRDSATRAQLTDASLKLEETQTPDIFRAAVTKEQLFKLIELLVPFEKGIEKLKGRLRNSPDSTSQGFYQTPDSGPLSVLLAQ